MKSNIAAYYPSIYEGVLETDILAEVEDRMLDDYFGQVTSTLNNQFVDLADIRGIENYERILGIIADPTTESLEFRRERIRNRFTLYPPFTIRFLRNKLDEIVGPGRWELVMDYNNYTLYLESTTPDFSWFNELNITLTLIKPANIVLALSPLIAGTMLMSETISVGLPVWNYVLDGRFYLNGTPFLTEGASYEFNYALGEWELGVLPFANEGEMEVIKLPTNPSLQAPFLAAHAAYTASIINKAIVNDTYTVTTFVQKDSDGNIATIRYDIPESAGLTTVTNVKLLQDDTVYTESIVAVEVTGLLTLKHTIEHKEEGTNARLQFTS